MRKLHLVLFCIVLTAIGGAIATAFPHSYVASAMGAGVAGLGMFGAYGGFLWGRKGFWICCIVGGLSLTYLTAGEIWLPSSGTLKDVAVNTIAGAMCGLMVSGFSYVVAKFANR